MPMNAQTRLQEQLSCTGLHGLHGAPGSSTSGVLCALGHPHARETRHVELVLHGVFVLALVRSQVQEVLVPALHVQVLAWVPPPALADTC